MTRGPLGDFKTQSCHIEPPAICQSQFKSFYPSTLLPQGFLLLSLSFLSGVTPYIWICVSNLGGCCLPQVFPSLMNLRRVVDFSVSSAIFYQLLGQIADIQASYVQKRKHQIQISFWSDENVLKFWCISLNRIKPWIVHFKGLNC